MKLLNNKYLYLLLLWSICGMLVSCSNDPIDYQEALKPLADSGPELTFGVNNTKIMTIQPTASTTDVISVLSWENGCSSYLFYRGAEQR